MTTTDALSLGREAYAEARWADAYEQLSSDDAAAHLTPADLEHAAFAAHLLGRDDDGVELLTRAHQGFVDAGDLGAAVRCAFWAGMVLMNVGEEARGGGWLARAGRLLEEADDELPEHGYLMIPAALQALATGDAAGALDRFRRAAALGGRFGDKDLATLSRMGQGQALVRLGELDAGWAALDDAMVSVTAGEVSPLPAGIIYCAVIETCQRSFELRRAQEWTAALAAWCERQPDVTPYGGHCQTHRSELMRLHGAWAEALEAARSACERFRRTRQVAVGAAHYQEGEIHRLRGRFADAEESYREASRWGHDPQPGLALLRLAQGQHEAAQAAIVRVLEEPGGEPGRPLLLAGAVEVLVATGDVAAARAAADELVAQAADVEAPWLTAVAETAHGAVLLAEGDARAACVALRDAWRGWQDIDAPYEVARTRTLLGSACRGLGDEDAARLEFDAAFRTFKRLGATTDLARVEKLLGRSRSPGPGGLTRRELEVIRLVASGMTNRQIAEDLVLSDKTVARHLSNIFTKLGVKTRAAATAYAYEHDLV